MNQESIIKNQKSRIDNRETIIEDLASAGDCLWRKNGSETEEEELLVMVGSGGSMKEETESESPKSSDEAARRFLADLLRHFHQDTPDRPEDLTEAASA